MKETKRSTIASRTPIYHGSDEQAARERAKKIEGQVIYSWKDKVRSEWGYWSEPRNSSSMLRNGERIVWQHKAETKRKSFNTCWICNGKGTSGYGVPCSTCRGTGKE
jgi:DnaJ-class molecular chaperone